MKRSAKFLEAIAAYDSDKESLALRLMEECAEAGDPVACYTAALWYKNGEGTAVNPARRDYWIARLEELAEQGSLEAQWELSGMHRWGDLLREDIECANDWLERAAQGGYGEAQHLLAWYYETGQYDYPMDPNEAAKWYQRAFEQEHPETLYLYAVRLFRDGQPTEEAIGLLKKAADNGCKQAQHVLDSYTH